ncbi:CDP-glycerol--poly(glycerophosphate) glycerophosphotransferase [Alteromonas mediterranea]|uniref:CDP-glycerol glycerophosphotransferase family protein n=1 Tax=Alteromonas mediterranea TaxID=314275 RepID=UPI00113256CB|nr:CDP-glycerol glycerophosphotransferase family protein [Alteromonas mediterranea]QDG33280.1 CDP-glycerol--poly(glycerophosphate) glycerophosphotransferase [Alteromonas mediterranea]
MKIAFDTVNVYYLPQFIPICDELAKRGHEVKLVCYSNKNKAQAFEQVLLSFGYEFCWVDDDKAARDLYLKEEPDWIFFGNGFSYLDDIHKVSKTAQLGHGIGPKPSYYHKSSTPMTVRFIEGKMRLAKIRELYPNDEFVQVGFSKLDPLFNNTEPGLKYDELGLDKGKPTLLFAPTFNPSSLECFPDDWPSHFTDFNILIKPHTFTYSREAYKNQRKKLKKWAQFNNTYVATETDISLLPFMKDADILISEASSTLFEFVALSKPVIVCNFFKLKWSYRGIFNYRFEKRFGKDNVIYKNIGLHINDYTELRAAIDKQLNNEHLYKEERKNYTQDHVGPTDGKSSLRIVDYIENN